MASPLLGWVVDASIHMFDIGISHIAQGFSLVAFTGTDGALGTVEKKR